MGNVSDEKKESKKEQEKRITVSGTVTCQGEPVYAVAVKIKDAGQAPVYTNMNGEYKISIPENGVTLDFSGLTLKTKYVEVKGEGVVDVVMDEEPQKYDNYRTGPLAKNMTVVTGYVKNSEISNYTSDAIDGYSGQLREMRILLSDLLSNKDKIDKSNTDKEYMADAKAIIDTLSKELNSINPDDEVEIIYLKQNMATLKAANALAQNEVKYSKNKITSEISDNIIKFTTTDLSRLSTIEKAFS